MMYDALITAFQISSVAVVPVLFVIDAPFGRFAVESWLNLNGEPMRSQAMQRGWSWRL